ncbi:MAG: 3-deoxy-7-phosphoheptulonate synthase [Chloroflexi bacterium]|nr:3-deoxy-7-phosphoheptulonate synthase [Chloroflexota bacterium]MCH8817404.1 3-deoxy-7-phosphoheptulonate synthase [Chloroflexota bacterium]
MIVTMERLATEEQIQAVVANVAETQNGTELIRGVERTVIGVVGDHINEDLRSRLQAMPGVEAVVRITRSYKLGSREFHPTDTVVNVKGVKIGGGNPPVVMAGPCSIESEEQLMSTAIAVKAGGAQILRGGAFKPRTTPYSFRGLKEEGLKLLRAAGDETGMPVVTELMSEKDVELVAGYTDIIQIGTRNAQNFMLLDAVGEIDTPVLLKRGFSNSYDDWLNAAEYILAGGNRNVILCERGIRTFESYTRNTLDIAAVPVIHRLSHLPVITDPSHGTGRWHLVLPMSVASIAAGADGLLIEVHPNPDHAMSDGPQSVTFENFARLMDGVRNVTSVGASNRVPLRAQPIAV